MDNTFSEDEKLYRAVWPPSHSQMYWKKNGVKNYTGDGKLHRWRKENLNELLRDYKKVA